MSAWPVWLVGAVLLVAAGVVVVVLPRRRRRRLDVRATWAVARDALTKAEISRDAATGDHPEADQLLIRAQRLIADGGGLSAARAATEYARAADRIWRQR